MMRLNDENIIEALHDASGKPSFIFPDAKVGQVMRQVIYEYVVYACEILGVEPDADAIRQKMDSKNDWSLLELVKSQMGEIEADIEKSNLGFQMEKLQRMNDSVSGK